MKRICLIIILLIPTLLFSQEHTLAVFYLETSPGGGLAEEDKKALSLALTEMTISDLSALQMLTLVERENLNQILEEQQRGLTGFLDESSTVQIGELLGARFILSGKLLFAGDILTISSRVSSVETGEILASATRVGTTEKLFTLREELVEELLIQWDIPLSRQERERLTLRDDLSLDGLINFGHGLNAQDRGDLDEARTFLARAVELNPDFSLAASLLEEIGKRFDSYLTARENDLPEEILEKIDALAQGDEKAEKDFSKMYWAYLQPLMMGFSSYGMVQAMNEPYRSEYFDNYVRSQWSQMGLTGEPESFDELEAILGNKFYKAHGILEYLLEEDLPLEGFNAYLHPVEGALGYYLSLFSYLSSAPDWHFPPMLKGEEVILAGKQLYPQLLSYCDMFLTNFPYSSYNGIVTPLMQTLLELTEGES